MGTMRPPRRLRLVPILFVLAALALPASALGAPPTPSATAERTAQNDRLAQRLSARFFTLLKTENARGLDAFLSPAFQLQRADGSSANKRQYLRNPAKVESFRISRVVGTRSGDTLVARYWVVTSETIDGQVYAKAAVPRLSTFQLTKRGWRLIAHANFNAPG